MIGYKIHYGEYDYDCYGGREWFGWTEYAYNKNTPIEVRRIKL